MKKLLLLALLIYGTSCSSPEDKATGNSDSTSFNHTGNEQNLNAPHAPDNQSRTNNSDTSMNPSSGTSENSSTQGTNRSYKAGGDSSAPK
jgi:hypothetical protein